MILIKHHLPLQVAKLSLFRNQMQEENGLHLVQVDVILGLIWSNTYATMQMRTKQDLNNFFYRIIILTTHKIPFMSSDDRAYLVDAYLRGLLPHPKPETLFAHIAHPSWQT